MLQFKERGVTDVKKVLIYGEDGSGKSTFAEKYCKENNLTPVVIDIDDTNYTNLPILNLDLTIPENSKTNIEPFRVIRRAIKEIIADGRFDTIIIDGVTSMLELFTSKAGGIKKYGDRAERFSAIQNLLFSSNMNLIFIGQIDMEPIFNEDFQSPKPVIKINSSVNEKYLTYKSGKEYSHKVLKYRVCENTQPKQIHKEDDVFVTADVVGEPNPEDDPLKSQCFMIKDMLESEGKPATKQNMKMKVVQVAREQGLPVDNKKALLEYIAKHCPEELE